MTAISPLTWHDGNRYSSIRKRAAVAGALFVRVEQLSSWAGS